MNDREKVIKGLRDIDEFIAGRVRFEHARNFLRTIDDAIDLLKEQERIIKLYEKADPFLHSHGWDWTQVEGWVKQE